MAEGSGTEEITFAETELHSTVAMHHRAVRARVVTGRRAAETEAQEVEGNTAARQ